MSRAKKTRPVRRSDCAVACTLDIIGDPLLWERDLYRFVSDHREGLRPVLAAPWRMSVSEAEIARGAPDLGEHDDYVRNQILSAHVMEGR